MYIVTNEMQPLSPTGAYIQLPYLPDHQYVFLKGTSSTVARATYYETQPSVLGTYKYVVEVKNINVFFLDMRHMT